MFLITPKASGASKLNGQSVSASLSQHNPTEPPAASRPIAKITRARVQKACDRCRVKKIKCDGVVPCLRCAHDEVICVVSKRDPNDLKAASRDYISCLENQQKSLIKTLQQISRNTPQAINAADLKEIIDTVRAHGYDFANVSEVPVTDTLGDVESSNNIGQGMSRKRRRSEENLSASRMQSATSTNSSNSDPSTTFSTTGASNDLSKQSSTNSSTTSLFALNNEMSKPTVTADAQATFQFAIDDYLNHAPTLASTTHTQNTDSVPMSLSEYAYIPGALSSSNLNLTASNAIDSDWADFSASTHQIDTTEGNSVLDDILLNEKSIASNISSRFPNPHQQSFDMLDSSNTASMWWDPTLILNSGIYHDVDSDPEIWRGEEIGF